MKASESGNPIIRKWDGALTNLVLAAMLCFSCVSCSYHRDNNISACMDVQSSAREIRQLIEKNEELGKRNRKLSKNPEINREKISENEKAIAVNSSRAESLEDESRRREKNCQPMFEDPQMKRARKERRMGL